NAQGISIGRKVNLGQLGELRNNHSWLFLKLRIEIYYMRSRRSQLAVRRFGKFSQRCGHLHPLPAPAASSSLVCFGLGLGRRIKVYQGAGIHQHHGLHWSLHRLANNRLGTNKAATRIPPWTARERAAELLRKRCSRKTSATSTG